MDIEWRDGDLGDREGRIKEYTLSDNVKAGLAWFIGITVNCIPLGIAEPYQSLNQLRDHYRQQREEAPQRRSGLDELKFSPVLPIEEQDDLGDFF